MREDGKGAPKGKPEINITPLVDVVLVLLIIFMVITPVVQKGFDGKVPKREGHAGPERSIVLEISADGNLRVNRQVVAEGELGEKLRAIFSVRPNETLFVAADDSVRYEEVIRVLDTCKMPGRVESIAFIMD